MKKIEHSIDVLIEKQNKDFADIGAKMLTIWELSLDERQYKELPIEIIRDWNKDKKS